MVQKPSAVYVSNNFKIFTSFEDQELSILQEMSALKPIEILNHLRQLINLAYGMHGYKPNHLPKQHTLTNIKYID